jgi:translation elongation factor EF-1alpha
MRHCTAAVERNAGYQNHCTTIGRYAGASLMESVDMLEPPVRLTARPLRLVIAEVMRTRSLGPAALAGKLESGAIRIGSKVGYPKP